MGFVKKRWKNRSAEHPNRRRLTYLTDGKSESVEVALDEGTIAEEGDLFSAETMNDLETRIGTAIDEVLQSYNDLKYSASHYEQVDIVPVANDNYDFIPSYNSVYKNGFLTLVCYILVKNPSADYTIIGNLPTGYIVQGATYYQDMSSDGSMLYCGGSNIGIRGGEKGWHYMKTFTIPVNRS